MLLLLVSAASYPPACRPKCEPKRGAERAASVFDLVKFWPVVFDLGMPGPVLLRLSTDEDDDGVIAGSK
jgi:hypothetical protein